MRRIGVLAAGELPRDIEVGDALATLSGIYARLISEGAFGEIQSVNMAGEIIACENQRILLADTTSVVSLPETVVDYYGCTDPYLTGCLSISNGTRAVRDGAVVIIGNHVTNTIQTFIRDAQANIWQEIDNLDLTAEAPMSRRDPNGLASYLALELCDEYGQSPSQITVTNAARWQMTLTHNWSQASPPTRGVYF